MKNQLLTIVCIVLLLSSCNNEAEQNSKKAIKDFTSYVDSVGKVNMEYTSGYWDKIEAGYKEKEAKAEAMAANMKEDAKKEMADTKQKFEELKAKYINEKKEYEVKLDKDKKQKMRDDLFGAGKVMDDMAFGWVTGQNVADVYHNFVDKVQANKDSYNDSDWNELRLWFKALDNRREEIKKDISGKDKIKIEEEKVKFSTLKLLNK